MSSETPEMKTPEVDEEMEKRGCGRSRLWFVPLILLAIAAKAGLVMLLWNELIPDLFHGPELKYFQALGLLVLAKVLVGGKGRHGFPGGGPGGRFGHHRHHGMKRKFWARMSHEEKCELRDHLRKRWKE